MGSPRRTGRLPLLLERNNLTRRPHCSGRPSDVRAAGHPLGEEEGPGGASVAWLPFGGLSELDGPLKLCSHSPKGHTPELLSRISNSQPRQTDCAKGAKKAALEFKFSPKIAVLSGELSCGKVRKAERRTAKTGSALVCVAPCGTGPALNQDSVCQN